jgi:putative ABC transport system substrate-binding protein
MAKPPLGLLLLCLAWAGPAGSAEVAILKSADVAAWRPTLDSLRKGAPNHNIAEYDLKGERAEGERVLASLKGRGVLVVAMGNLAAQLARELAPESPLIFCMIQDPAKLGLIGASNTTGVAFTIPIKNQLAAFRMVYPRAVRIGVIYQNENVGRQIQEAEKAAPVVRLNMVGRPVTSEREIPEALRSLLKGNQAMDALWIPGDPILLGDETRHFLLGETLKAAKPVYGFSSALVQEGALVSDGPDYASIVEEVAELLNRLAAGEKGSKIEMLIPRSELVINKKMADKLKIEIPADALRIANKVF